MGGGGQQPFYFGTNMGNRNLTGWRQAVANVLDFSGAGAYTMGALGGEEAANEMNTVTGQTEKPADPVVPPDPAIAQAQATEDTRQEEMRKRRMRTKTLLSSQEDTGTATVGQKTLLGG